MRTTDPIFDWESAPTYSERNMRTAVEVAAARERESLLRVAELTAAEYQDDEPEVYSAVRRLVHKMRKACG